MSVKHAHNQDESRLEEVMTLRIQDDGAVRELTLARPDVLNAFDRELYDLLADALTTAATDPGVSVVVLTGEGRAFSAGTDLEELRGSAEGRRAAVRAFEHCVDALVTFPKPLLCAVNGPAVGAGATLLHHADIVLMAEDAKVRYPFAGMGVAPEAGSSWTLPRLVGPAAAAWILLTGEWVPATECVELGLAWQCYPGTQLLPEAHRLAQTIAAHPLRALVETKALLRDPHAAAVADSRRREAAAFKRLLAVG